MERLKVIKETAQHFKEYDFYTTVEYEDFLWLIEQAEKAEDLEKQVKEKQDELDHLKATYDHAIITNANSEAKPKKTFDL